MIHQYDIFSEITAELNRARAKFPDSKHTLAALTEEVGELAQALLKVEYETGSHTDVFQEAIQVAVMAIRIAVEGDSTFPKYHPESGYRGKNWAGYKVEKKVSEWHARHTIFTCSKEMSVELELVDGTFVGASVYFKHFGVTPDIILRTAVAIDPDTDISQWIERSPKELLRDMYTDFPILFIKRWREINL